MNKITAEIGSVTIKCDDNMFNLIQGPAPYICIINEIENKRYFINIPTLIELVKSKPDKCTDIINIYNTNSEIIK